MRTPPRSGGKRGGDTDAGDVTGRRRSELQEVVSNRKGMMAMTHGDEKRGTEDTEPVFDVIRDALPGMEPDEAAAVADLLPSMVPVAATEWITAYSGWSVSATTDDLLKTAFHLASDTVAAQRLLRAGA